MSEHNECVPVNIHRFSFLLSAAKNEHQEPTVDYGFIHFLSTKRTTNRYSEQNRKIKKKNEDRRQRK